MDDITGGTVVLVKEHQRVTDDGDGNGDYIADLVLIALHEHPACGAHVCKVKVRFLLCPTGLGSDIRLRIFHLNLIDYASLLVNKDGSCALGSDIVCKYQRPIH